MPDFALSTLDIQGLQRCKSGNLGGSQDWQIFEAVNGLWKVQRYLFRYALATNVPMRNLSDRSW